MEIGEQGVNEFEFIAGGDEQFGCSGGRLDGAGVGERFEGSYGGGSHGDEALFVCDGVVNDLSVGGVEGVVFGVHAMIFDVLGGDGSEGAQADVQGDAGDAYAELGHLVEDVISEMQAGGGGGDGAG